MTVGVGTGAPEFSQKGIDGETYDLADALGRGPVLLVFFKSSCATCDLAFPYVNRLLDSYPGDGWSLWAVAQDAHAEASSYASTFEMTYPVLPDADGYPVSKAYDPPATPTFYLLDHDGQVVEHSAGFDKGELNRISLRLAERLGVDSAVIARPDDGNPDSKPG